MNSLVEDFPITVAMALDPDVSTWNPLQFSEVVPSVRDRFLTIRRQLNDSSHGVIGVYANGGPGWLRWKQISRDFHDEVGIDWVFNTPENQQLARSSEEYLFPNRQLLSALGCVHIDAGTVLHDPARGRPGSADVSREGAQSLLTTGLVDRSDFKNTVNLVAHNPVYLQRNPLHGSVAEVAAAVNRTATALEFSFDPANWAWWRESPREEAPTVGEPRQWAILPESYDDIGSQDGLDVCRANVAEPHVLQFQRIDDGWVQELRHDAVTYLDEHIRTDNDPLRAAWASMCWRNGDRDPVARWERYRAEHVDPVLN
jgi:hypothetical protein